MPQRRPAWRGALSLCRLGAVAAFLRGGALQFPVSEYGISMVTRASVAYAHKRGLQVHVWTINDKSTMHGLLDLSVDGLMTDDCAAEKSAAGAQSLVTPYAKNRFLCMS